MKKRINWAGTILCLALLVIVCGITYSRMKTQNAEFERRREEVAKKQEEFEAIMAENGLVYELGEGSYYKTITFPEVTSFPEVMSFREFVDMLEKLSELKNERLSHWRVITSDYTYSYYEWVDYVIAFENNGDLIITYKDDWKIIKEQTSDELLGYCLVDGCRKRAETDGKYCKEHTCEEPRCYEKKVNGKEEKYCAEHRKKHSTSKKNRTTSKSAGYSFDPADYDHEDDYADDAFGEDFYSYEDAVEAWEND